MHSNIRSNIASFLFVCCLLLQNTLLSQLVGFGIRSYNTQPIKISSCKGAAEETYKAFMVNDSLYFENAEGKKQTIASAKNKGGPALNAVPGIVYDNSSGPNKGRIYICWSSEKNGLRNKDVFIVYSDDGGKTWIEPVLVTYRPNHRAQVMPVMTIDQTTGAVYILYHDSQNYFEDVTDTDVYLAISTNGGLKFDQYKLNSAPLKITLNTQERNYLKLNAEHGIITASWNQNGKKSSPLTNVIIDKTFFANYQKTDLSEIIFEKTISFAPQIKINLTADKNIKLTAAFTKPVLPGFEKLAVKNFQILPGSNLLIIDTKKIGLQKGNYTLTLYYNGKNDFIWITEE